MPLPRLSRRDRAHRVRAWQPVCGSGGGARSSRAEAQECREPVHGATGRLVVQDVDLGALAEAFLDRLVDARIVIASVRHRRAPAPRPAPAPPGARASLHAPRRAWLSWD